MPNDLFFKVMNTIHHSLLNVSGGRIGWAIGGMPVLKLTTVGRKSGTPQSVLLTIPAQEDGRLVIVASKGGADTHPSWFLNLQQDHHVIVTMKGKDSFSMVARVASGKEHERLWLMITSKHDNYASYQGKTARKIPVVILESS